MRWLFTEKAKRAFFALWCVGWVVVAVKSLEPNIELPLGLSDKTVHFSVYAVMAAAVGELLPPARPHPGMGRTDRGDQRAA